MHAHVVGQGIQGLGSKLKGFRTHARMHALRHDPPLTDEGRQQARNAAVQLRSFMAHSQSEYAPFPRICCLLLPFGLVHIGPGLDLSRPRYAPFSRVYCSPLRRCVGTAVEFGKELGLAVAPLAGLATCTAAFKCHGAAENPLLPLVEVLCP